MKKRKAKKARAKKARKIFRVPHKAAKKKRPAKARRKKRVAPKSKKRRVKARKRAPKKRRAKVAPVQKNKTRKTKTKGPKMAKRKRSKGKRSKGIFGSQRGAASLPPKKMFIRVLQKLAHGAEGVTTAKITAAIISKLPITSPKWKAGIQVAAGVAGSFVTDSKPWLRGLSDGPFYIGSAALAKAFGVDTMAGEEDYHLAVDAAGNVREMTGDELAELRGNFQGEDNFAMKGNFDGDDGDDMEGDFGI